MLIDSLQQECRYSLRSLRKAPLFTASAVAVLALAIGANSALFSVIHAVLLRPLPYHQADRLVVVRCERRYADAAKPVPATFSLDELRDWRQALPSFEAVSFYLTDPQVLRGKSGSEVRPAAIVSSEFFSTIGGRLAAGRPLGSADEQAPAVVISERLSGQLFADVREALGARLELNSRPYDVVGVMSRSFALPAPDIDLWLSAEYQQTLKPRKSGFRLIGRVKSGVSLDGARSDLNSALRILGDAKPAAFGNNLHATALGLRDQIVGDMRSTLLILWAAGGLILLVGCANVANLLLARNVALSRERALQVALGANRGRLLMRALADGGFLAAMGTVVGVGLATLAARGFGRFALMQPTLPTDVGVSVPVLFFAIALGSITTLAIAAFPAMVEPTALSISLRTFRPGARRLARALCVVELAVSTVLLVEASLLGRSLSELLHTDIGVNPAHVTAVSLRLAFQQQRHDAELVALADRIVEHVRELPGLEAAGLGSALPPREHGLTLTLKRKGDQVDYAATAVIVTPGYFEALGVRLIKGRFFTAGDDASHPPVIIMSQATTRRLFGDGDAIGRTLTLPTLRDGVNGSEEMTVVGIVAPVKYSGLAAEADEQVYRPFAQQPWSSVFLVARATGAAVVAPMLRRQIAEVDPSLAVVSIKDLETVVAEDAASPWLRSVLLGAMAFLGVAIAAVGLYGVVAYSVSQRTSEIAIRLALGANRFDVERMVLKEGLVLGVLGTTIGLGAAFVISRLLRSFLFGIASADPVSFLLSASMVLICTLLASYFPARRAGAVEPLTALRME